MVNSRLHIICGNCGADKEDLYYVRGEICQDSGDQSAICCKNCGTRHSIFDNLAIEIKPKGENNETINKRN